jgi:SAM-dependent methyltransferase
MDDLEWKIQDYWNRQPCNVNHSQQPLGTVEYFDEVTTKRYRAEPHILDFAGFHRWRGRRVLEIGCGIGTDAEQFARHGAEYVGIDISKDSIALSLQRFKVLDLHGKFYEMNLLEAVPEELERLGKFDLVYSYGVLHHFPNIESHIKRISELLTDHGEFRFMVYAKNSWKYAMIQKGLDQFEAQAECPYAEAFTKEEVTQLLDPWFRVERIRQDHCFMYNVPEYKQGKFELEPWFAAMPETMRDAVKEYLGWHLLVKARKHETYLHDMA